MTTSCKTASKRATNLTVHPTYQHDVNARDRNKACAHVHTYRTFQNTLEGTKHVAMLQQVVATQHVTCHNFFTMS